MSDRDRVLVAAAAIGLIFCALIWGAVGVGALAKGQGPPNNADVYQGSGHQQRNAEPDASALAAQACADDATSASDETEHGRSDKRDLCAQFIAAAAADRAASFAFQQTAIGALGLAFILATLIANAIATFAATAQATTAREHLERMETPFLRAVPDKPREADYSKGETGFDWLEETVIRFENCGRSYAIVTHATIVIDPVWEITGKDGGGYFSPDTDLGTPQGRGCIVPADGKSLPFTPLAPNSSDIKARLAGEGGFVHGIARFEDPLGKRWVMGFSLLYVPVRGEYFTPGEWRDAKGNAGNYHQREETLPSD